MCDHIEFPATIQDLPTPCAVVDIDVVKRNAQNMLDRCKSLGVKLRPMMKTHKCLEAGVLLTGGSKRCMSASTLSEAEFFAEGGFDDILYTSIFTADKLPRMKQLSDKLKEFHVMIDSETGFKLLESNPLPDKKWSVFVMVDVGGCRAGTVWDDPDSVELVKKIDRSTAIDFRGLYSHEGNVYNCRGREEIREMSDEAAERILELANKLKSEGIRCPDVGLGATPSATYPGDKVRELTELHPGNYAFYDLMQCVIGACTVEDIPLRVATRVTGHYPRRKEMLVDCGFLALSHDGKLSNGSYCVVHDRPNLRLKQISQEVGYIQPLRGDIQYERNAVGSMLFLLPYHSCSTAAMHPVYYVHSGEKIVDVWRPCRGW